MSRKDVLQICQKIINKKIESNNLFKEQIIPMKFQKTIHHILYESDKRIIAKRFFYANPILRNKFNKLAINKSQKEKQQISIEMSDYFIQEELKNKEYVVFPLDKYYEDISKDELQYYLEFNIVAYNQLKNLWTTRSFADTLTSIVRLQTEETKDKHNCFEIDNIFPTKGKYVILSGLNLIRNK